MSINLSTEQLRSYSQAAKIIPPGRFGRPTSPATLWRWATRGVRARDGRLVILESVKLGGRSVTSVEALERFAAALSGRPDEPIETAPRRTPNERRRASERADAELQALGV